MLNDSTNNFIIRSDGSFNADIGSVDLIKAIKTPEGEGYHIVARASTPDKDRDGEVLLQKGLNFDPFKEHGELNWNHIPHCMIGVPVGKKAWLDEQGWMIEGMVVKGMPIWDGYTSDDVIKQHNQLKKSGFNRGLCCSVEGKVTERSEDGKYVQKADIYNVALTFRPVNPTCTVSVLAKSMAHHAILETNDAFYKSLAVSNASAFVKEDVEGGSPESFEGKLVKHLCKKGYSEKDARAHVHRFFNKKFSGKGA